MPGGRQRRARRQFAKEKDKTKEPLAAVATVPNSEQQSERKDVRWGIPSEPTPEDVLELKERPVRHKWTDFTENQLALRVAIGEKWCRRLLDMDTSCSAEMARGYEEYPMWGFYVVNGLPKRVYGMCVSVDSKTKEKEYLAHTASAMLMFVNLTVGGTPLAKLERVERWTPTQLQRIRLTNAPGYFVDPLGFVLLIEEHSK